MRLSRRLFLSAVMAAGFGCGDFDTGGGGDGAGVNFASGYAFVRDGDVYVADKSDYQANKRLTSSGADSEPALSRDGRVIVFVHTDPSTGVTSIRKIASDGTGESEVVGGSSERTLSQPAVNRDGSKVAFVSSAAGTGTSKVTLVNLDGSGEKAVAGSLRDSSPSFSPDGRYLFVLSGPDTMTRGEIVKVEVSAGVRTSVFSGSGLGQRVAVSPDGARLAFEKRKGDGKMGIHRVDAAGGSASLLAETGGNDLSPTWVSGSRVGFTSDVGGMANIYEIDLGDSTDAYRLTVGAAEECSYGG